MSLLTLSQPTPKRIVSLYLPCKTKVGIRRLIWKLNSGQLRPGVLNS